MTRHAQVWQTIRHDVELDDDITPQDFQDAVNSGEWDDRSNEVVEDRVVVLDDDTVVHDSNPHYGTRTPSEPTGIPKVDDPGEGHVTFVYRNQDSGQHIPYVMNLMAANEVNSAATAILDALDDVRAGTGDPLAAIESLSNWLLQIAGQV